jgi:hypothetical protein
MELLLLQQRDAALNQSPANATLLFCKENVKFILFGFESTRRRLISLS